MAKFSLLLSAWMIHTKENKGKIELKLLIQRPKAQKSKGDSFMESQGSE